MTKVKIKMALSMKTCTDPPVLLEMFPADMGSPMDQNEQPLWADFPRKGGMFGLMLSTFWRSQLP